MRAGVFRARRVLQAAGGRADVRAPLVTAGRHEAAATAGARYRRAVRRGIGVSDVDRDDLPSPPAGGSTRGSSPTCLAGTATRPAIGWPEAPDYLGARRARSLLPQTRALGCTSEPTVIVTPVPVYQVQPPAQMPIRGQPYIAPAAGGWARPVSPQPANRIPAAIALAPTGGGARRRAQGRRHGRTASAVRAAACPYRRLSSGSSYLRYRFPAERRRSGTGRETTGCCSHCTHSCSAS